MIHEDNRRALISHPYKKGEFKILKANEDCEVGNHYHKIKTETFQLLEGSAMAIIDGKMIVMNRHPLVVQPGTKHSFILEKDSLLFCICSHPYSNDDDYND